MIRFHPPLSAASGIHPVDALRIPHAGLMQTAMFVSGERFVNPEPGTWNP